MRRQATEISGVGLEYSGKWYVVTTEQLGKLNKCKFNQGKETVIWSGIVIEFFLNFATRKDSRTGYFGVEFETVSYHKSFPEYRKGKRFYNSLCYIGIVLITNQTRIKQD